ncbi:barstar family protein [Pseudomonas atacamensis]|uniref:barstar family protein n=1 Tax=Pseudomonas atacamensis TaxID=2565368 RepID=UPI003CB7AB9C
MYFKPLLHKRIASAFAWAKYYGNNLNSLWDLLSTDVERPIEIAWKNSKESEQSMGETFKKNIYIRANKKSGHIPGFR